ncbi:uncharacterized protein LOC135488768 [Lineus longissimus]|uniref:uncharacterized protein LOC135488768 n=1 Tax=Lineus longissimus TaxID=88925 RepID=UPI002B4C2DA4
MLRPLILCLVLCVILELAFAEDSLNREERGARGRQRKKQKKDRADRGDRDRSRKSGCKYEKPTVSAASWGPCVDGKKSRNATLVKARRGRTCEPSKIFEKPCTASRQKVEKCRYKKKDTAWSTCINGKKTKVLALLPTSGTSCNATKTITKDCRVRAGRQGRDSSAVALTEKACKYTKGDWSECVDGKRTRTNTRKPTSEASCPAQQVIEKNCKSKKPKKAICKYEPDGQGWGPCTSGQKVRTLVLKPGSPTDCAATKALRKRCKLRECKYQKGSIGECNQETQMLNRTDVLKSKADASCPPTKLVEVPCSRPNSRPKMCEYGPWEKYGPCLNGVKKKIREITLGQGNQRCEKKAVKIMACEDSEQAGDGN